MSWGMVAVAAIGAVGAGMSASAAEDAADAQAQSASNATALQKYIFDEQKKMQQPWLNAGNAGLNKLGYLLGLSPNGFGGSNSGAGGQLETADQIRARLSGAYTTRAPGSYSAPGADAEGATPGAYGPDVVTVDNVKLDAAVKAEMARQKKQLDLQNRLTAAGARGDSEYGSLLDKFGMDDFKADPGYAFRQSEGEKALQRQLSAGGKYYSGEAMKDMARFSQGLASQEYGAAFDRFNVGQTNTFNRLASISGVGQTAANQTGAAGQNYANQAGQNMIGAGNAQAAGQVGAANAWTGALGQGVSAYQQNQLLKSLQPQSQTPSYYGGLGGGSGNYNYGGGY